MPVSVMQPDIIISISASIIRTPIYIFGINVFLFASVLVQCINNVQRLIRTYVEGLLADNIKVDSEIPGNYADSLNVAEDRT
jgi:hypothetical protein